MSAAVARIESYEDFVKSHTILLAASGFPEPLHRKLFQKLTAETFDGGNYFQVEPVEDGRQRRLVLTADFLGKDSDVFLVDHAWTFRLNDAYKQLQEVPGLVERMASLMCVDIDLDSEADDENDVKLSAAEIVEKEFCRVKDEGIDSVRWLELEDLEIDDDLLVSLDLPAKFPQLLALSLCGNKLKNSEIVLKVVTHLKSLRALWLNHNPILKTGDNYLEDSILLNCPELEIYNSLFTPKYAHWALGFCGGLYEKDSPGDSYQSDNLLQSVTSLDLSNRCIHNLINKAFSPFEMPSILYLNLRGNPLNENSVAELLKYLRGFINLTVLEVDIPGPLGEDAVDIIETLPSLSLLNGLTTSRILESEKSIVDSMLKPRLPEFNAGESLIDRVVSAMWLYLMTYRLADEEKIDETSVWYVMDELGSALRHSDEANFRVSPFLYMPDGKLDYSILWPTKNVRKDDECTLDYLFGIGEDRQRSARLTAWFHTPQNYFFKEYEKYNMKLHSKKFSSPPPVMPSATNCLLNSDGSVLHVYTDIPQVEEFLNRPEFVITTEPENADIVWTSAQVDEEMKRTVGLNDQQYTNQFPFEACLVMKHHLAETVQKAHGAPMWLQPTYNLETHLTQLVGDYYSRERDGVDNLWILKPWNMARTIDTTVTQSLSAIIRLMETGPKICQKYIEHPALFKGRKFDLRYIVLVRSMNPLEIFLADVFWVRLANNTYSLEKHSLFEYETHFTVMVIQWLGIHLRVKQMIRSVFESAAAVHPEMHSPTSRSMYGVDVMLDRSYQPKLLEVTYCPDCTRACKYDVEAVMGGGGIVKGSDFYNYVFGCLFLNETTHVSPL
ncbi:tubulin--tyrosine ligase-like protein 12 [Phtheirospermum japonicum]|uniref:Tubulin--tyrosine ligase-like protein 12 n=1 Tax=Phtheirospermum japonicum TaxID=374723 RepID=A0A830BD20_9LAMI|nr:tubulin--tyrosine ligase-like protein 12 [Phtheirospermum japonicum]